MVIKTIERIKKTLPEVEHIILFYNDGTVYQTTFEQFEESVNIPKLGENLSELLTHLRTLYSLSNYKFKGFNQLLFNTDDISVLIIKLGEDSNLALFYRTTIEKEELQLESIQRYLIRIQKLTDIGRIELIEREIKAKERYLKELHDELDEKLEKHKKKRRFAYARFLGFTSIIYIWDI